ncbi:MAG: beta-N-acetylhexosaminidase [Spirochaetaceae bacterium]
MSLWHRVLPQPTSVLVEEGSFLLTDSLSFVSGQGPKEPHGGAYATLLTKALGVPVREHRSGTAGEGEIHIIEKGDLSDEAYRITVQPSLLTLEGGSYEAIARAASTLASYRLQAGSGFEAIRACAIEDAPRYKWRGAMVDVARHFFPLRALEAYLDILFIHKVNYFHLHLTDDQGWRYPVEGWPKLIELSAYRDDRTTEYGRYGGYYTAAELRSLDAYAADLGITIVPEVDLPGHTSSVFAAYPQLSCRQEPIEVPTRWGIFEDVLCVGNEEVFEFLTGAIGSLASIFSGPYIHLGGDETPANRWRECPKCRSRMETEALSEPEDLHGYFMNRAAELVIRAGRRPVVWDEAISPQLSREAVIMCWRGRSCVKEALEAGFAVVAVPQDRACYFDHKHLDDPREPGRLGFCTVKDAGTYDPDPEGTEERVLGVQGNIWTEEILYERQLEQMSFPRLAALMATGWSGSAGWHDRRELVERHRDRLLQSGVHAYPGPLGQ